MASEPSLHSWGSTLSRCANTRYLNKVEAQRSRGFWPLTFFLYHSRPGSPIDRSIRAARHGSWALGLHRPLCQGSGARCPACIWGHPRQPRAGWSLANGRRCSPPTRPAPFPLAWGRGKEPPRSLLCQQKEDRSTRGVCAEGQRERRRSHRRRSLPLGCRAPCWRDAESQKAHDTSPALLA